MKSKQIKVMAVTAILMAFNIVLSSFGVPVPGGHMYLNDVIICTAAILLDPFGAFMVGGGGRVWGGGNASHGFCSRLEECPERGENPLSGGGGGGGAQLFSPWG